MRPLSDQSKPSFKASVAHEPLLCAKLFGHGTVDFEEMYAAVGFGSFTLRLCEIAREYRDGKRELCAASQRQFQATKRARYSFGCFPDRSAAHSPGNSSAGGAGAASGNGQRQPGEARSLAE